MEEERPGLQPKFYGLAKLRKLRVLILNFPRRWLPLPAFRGCEWRGRHLGISVLVGVPEWTAH